MFEQIIPARILGDDQVRFPLPWPVFKPSLPSNRRHNVVVSLDVNQASEPVTSGEYRCGASSVLPGAAADVVRDTGMESAERPVRHDVNPATTHGPMIAVCWLRKRQRDGVLSAGVTFRRTPKLSWVARTSRAMTNSKRAMTYLGEAPA